MRRLFVCNGTGQVTADIDAGGAILSEALDHQEADAVIRCALLMALSALVKGGTWPTAALQAMFGFMTSMRSEIRTEELC